MIGDGGEVLATVPVPLPVLITLNVKVDGGGQPRSQLNVAVTVLAASIVTPQMPVPAHAPLQPLNCQPAAGVAINVTTVPLT